MSNGTLVLNANGSFSYTPDANYTGGDSSVYTVTDADSGESSTGTVTLTVNPVNDLPGWHADYLRHARTLDLFDCR